MLRCCQLEGARARHARCLHRHVQRGDHRFCHSSLHVDQLGGRGVDWDRPGGGRIRYPDQLRSHSHVCAIAGARSHHTAGE